jgi:salicylate hydroxylase
VTWGLPSHAAPLRLTKKPNPKPKPSPIAVLTPSILMPSAQPPQASTKTSPQPEALHVAVAGAGIGGLSAALALTQARADIRITLLEQTPVLSALGAGVQLGPNAVRRLQAWGLGDALQTLACQPTALHVHSAKHKRTLATLRLGERSQQRYGAPALTLLRADLQAMLLSAVQREPRVALHLNAALQGWTPTATGVTLQSAHQPSLTAHALVAANGVHSAQRLDLQPNSPLISTHHTLFRSLIDLPPSTASTHFPRPASAQNDQSLAPLLTSRRWPADLDPQAVHVWLGAGVHAVAYAVSGGRQINLVVDAGAALRSFAAPAAALLTASAQESVNAGESLAPLPPRLAAALTQVQHSGLQHLIQSATHWSSWDSLHTAPVGRAAHMASGRLALLGDAAHPMLPHLAQGAAMAIEDASALAQTLQHCPNPTQVPRALAAYAASRHARAARVQRTAARNVSIFQATGFIQWGRDCALRWGGEALLDMPWLYAH